MPDFKDVVLVPYKEVWFKYNGDVCVGSWEEDNAGNIQIKNIQKTLYKEVPFVKVSRAR